MDPKTAAWAYKALAVFLEKVTQRAEAELRAVLAAKGLDRGR